MMSVLRRAWAFLLASLAAPPAAIWILKHQRHIRHHGRPLESDETAFATHLGISNPGSVRILVRNRIPSPLGGLITPLERRLGFSIGDAAGVTLGRGIYITQGCESPGLVAHELVHVRQYEKSRSPLVFIWHYFFQCLVFGYHDAPLEREAVQLSERQ